MTHLVNTLRLDITCDSEESAFELRHHLAPQLQQQVASAVEKAARDITDPGDLVIIDRIEIDLGAISLHTHELVLASAIDNEVSRQLQQYLHPKSKVEKNNIQQQNITELFRHFMFTGSLPWWAHSMQPDISNVFMELMDSSRNWLIGFLYENRASQVFWQRMVFQLNAEAKKKIAGSVEEIKLAVALLQEKIIQLQKTGSATRESTSEEKPGTEIIRDNIPVSGLPDTGTVSEKNLLDILLLDAPLIYKGVSENYLWQALEMIIKKNIQVPGIEALLFGIEKRKPQPEAGKDINPALTADNKPADDTLSAAKPGNMTMQNETFIREMEKDHSGEEVEKYFITHSGIILLSPFLKPFFNRLQLLEDMQWKNSSCCYKAVHLLKYLACGKTGIAEYGLTFEKIICGLSPGIPVPLDAELELHEINEADTLLKDVIGHWKAIKNTSINGLRETFLKRDGIIIKKDDGWLLKPERKTADVLLEMIPWGFSIVRFPWSRIPVFTEW